MQEINPIHLSGNPNFEDVIHLSLSSAAKTGTGLYLWNGWVGKRLGTDFSDFRYCRTPALMAGSAKA
jgi:hypothetical protein